jgi:uncharacterized cofD-like protein
VSGRGVGAAPRVVAVGGGHGLAATIRATRRYAGCVTAVVATADDGGSTGRLRRDMPALPAPGDIRRCLAAMAAEGDAGDHDEPLAGALEFRFEGTDIEGHALGNLLLAGLTAVTGDFAAAVDEVARLLGIDPARGRVVPATAEPVRLVGRTAAGAEVAGEVEVSRTGGLRRVRVVATGHGAGCPPAPKAVIEALAEADQVVLGPGSLYSSVLSAVAVEDVRDAIAASRGQRVYVCNLRPEPAETLGYDVAAHVEALVRHGVTPDVVVVQPGAYRPRPRTLEARVVEVDVARPHGLAHDSAKLGEVLSALLPTPRAGRAAGAAGGPDGT